MLSANATDQQELLHLQVAAVFFDTFLIFISSTTFHSAIRASGPVLFFHYIIEITPVKILPERIAEQFRPESASSPAFFDLATVARQVGEHDRLYSLPALLQSLPDFPRRSAGIKGTPRHGASGRYRDKVRAAGIS
jgi:hypothetical protein